MNALALQVLAVGLLVVAGGYGLARWALHSKRIRTRTRTKHFLFIGYSIRGLLNVRSAYIRLPLGKRFVLWEKEK